MSKELFVNTESCTLCEVCIDSLPEVFGLSAEGLCIVHNPNGADKKDIQEVKDICPAECIRYME